MKCATKTDIDCTVDYWWQTVSERVGHANINNNKKGGAGPFSSLFLSCLHPRERTNNKNGEYEDKVEASILPSLPYSHTKKKKGEGPSLQLS